MATTKQKLVASKLLENTGKSVSRAMKEAGYKKGSCKNPQQLTRSKGWQELMDSMFPEKKLLQKHRQLLESTTLASESFPKTMSDKDIAKLVRKVKGAKLGFILAELKEKIAYFVIPNIKAQDSALDKAYKLRGSYQTGKNQNDTDSKKYDEIMERMDRILPNAGT